MGHVIVAIALLSGLSLHGQSPGPKFEVASLKRSAPGGRGGGIRPSPGGERYIATNATLRMMLMVAYGVRNEQIVGGPDWINTDRFDMNAKAEKPSTIDELHLMLQDLVAERFQLKLHREKKDLPIYVLSVDKDNPKLESHTAQNAGEPWIEVEVVQFPRMRWHAKFATMDLFARRLGEVTDRPVVNQTGLTGGFDFDLEFTRELPPGVPENANINGVPLDTSGPTIFEAVRKLGLKLERQKGPVETIVIDKIEKPVEN
jgi:uncharacterized protein (TIGR03435 family)